MRKTLLALGAAAALAVSAGGVSADPVTITFDTNCTATLTTTGNTVSALLAGSADDNCQTGFGTGYNGKVKSFGNGTGLAVHFSGDDTNYYLVISMPYVTGGTWRLYNTADGVTLTSTNGSYSVNSAAEVRARRTKSVTSH
ncbi:MAG TPA: hypothetical protein VHE09_01250 [Rhizomicrobium sp.]|nr:hypothetical protein [Rhizomicrobium sp.]